MKLLAGVMLGLSVGANAFVAVHEAPVATRSFSVVNHAQLQLGQTGIGASAYKTSNLGMFSAPNAGLQTLAAPAREGNLSLPLSAIIAANAAATLNAAGEYAPRVNDAVASVDMAPALRRGQFESLALEQLKVIAAAGVSEIAGRQNFDNGVFVNDAVVYVPAATQRSLAMRPTVGVIRNNVQRVALFIDPSQLVLRVKGLVVNVFAVDRRPDFSTAGVPASRRSRPSAWAFLLTLIPFGALAPFYRIYRTA